MTQSEPVALITGASSGIGEEFAKLHAEAGGDLILVARRLDRLNTLKDSLEQTFGIRVTVIAQDLAQPGAAQTVYDAVNGQGIRIDYLINNAGHGGRGDFHSMDPAMIDSQMQLNMVALTQLTRLFLPDMVARGSGRVLNVSSTASFFPGPLQAVYFATKAYVTFLSNALSEELKGTGVTVTALMPGATESEFAKVSGMDKTNLFEQTFPARDVAKAGYEAMLAGEMDIVAGVTTSQNIMLKLSAFMPKRSMLKTIYKMQQVQN
ncbi:MAG: SDR family NAD(P)-dependent oxidoreductase [Rhodobacteraceae bacterium]|nr:SDR family NAD(P)-dependent oxidoreductase [Paracoccaceae bacterium]